MKSLRETLTTYIREHGYASYGEIVQLTLEYGAKLSNAERRLRHSESPNIRAVMGVSKRKTSFIKGYEWKEEKIPTHLLVNFGNGTEMIKINGKEIPIYTAPKKNVEKGLF